LSPRCDCEGSVRAVLFHNIVSGAVDHFDRTLSRTPQRRFAELVDQWAREHDIVGHEEALRRAAHDDGRPALVVTFDDGYAGVHDAALPVLRERGLVATVFIVTRDGGALPPSALLHFEELELAFRLTAAKAVDVSSLGLGRLGLASGAERIASLRTLKRVLKCMPEAERARAAAKVFDQLGIDRDSLSAEHGRHERFRKLSRVEIHALLDAGWTVGGHTRTHPVLSRVSDEQLWDEVDGCARDLARGFGLTGVPFAYPFGGAAHVDPRAAAAARAAGFTCAFTTVPLDNNASTDPYGLHRFSATELQLKALDRGTTPAETTRREQ